MRNQFSRFLTVGVFNTLFGYGIIFGAMYLMHMSPQASNALGYSIVLLASFALHRSFTFKSVGNRTNELTMFLLVFVVAFGANIVVLHLLVSILYFHEGVSQIMAGVIYVLISYVMNKKFVFRHQGENQGDRT